VSRAIPAAARRAVLERAAERCEECGAVEALAFHHLTPWAEGGTHDVANLRYLCRDCHRKAHGHREMSEAETISYRLSPETLARIDRVADTLHVPKSGVVEMAVRLLAKREGVD
jgi:5-methylcytosine-specific restriction endonuclease McrA